MRFVLALGAFNVAAFTAARLAGFPLWYVIGAELLGGLLWFFWGVQSHPARRLQAQGPHLGWTYVESVRDDNGLRNAQFARGNCVAEVSWAHAHVWLHEPYPAGPFADFVELERYLAQQAPPR